MLERCPSIAMATAKRHVISISAMVGISHTNSCVPISTTCQSREVLSKSTLKIINRIGGELLAGMAPWWQCSCPVSSYAYYSFRLLLPNCVEGGFIHTHTELSLVLTWCCPGCPGCHMQKHTSLVDFWEFWNLKCGTNNFCHDSSATVVISVKNAIL